MGTVRSTLGWGLWQSFRPISDPSDGGGDWGVGGFSDGLGWGVEAGEGQEWLPC